MSGFHPLRTLDLPTINASVAVGAILDTVSKRAPIIVVLTLCSALLGAWTSAPVWLANVLAAVVGSLALILLAARGRRHSLVTPPEELGFAGLKERIAYELAGNGTPPGYYLLGFFGFLTIMLTGFQSPYGMLAFSGFALGVVWGIVNARYPSD
jgi:hypothetical protein